MSKKVFIIGATSAIAESFARKYAMEHSELCLLARNEEKLNLIAEDLRIRGAAKVTQMIADVNETESHDLYIAQAIENLGSLDVVLIAHGTLPDQADCEKDVLLSLQEIKTNGTSTISFLARLAQVLEAQDSGSLAVISSVAGDRGRQSNYTYGAAKALVSTFTEGMISRFNGTGVHVLLIKPGFVDTPMTRAFDKGPLWVQPENVAEAIVKAISKKTNVLYVPLFWWAIMQVIKNIPTFIFKKLSI